MTTRNSRGHRQAWKLLHTIAALTKVGIASDDEGLIAADPRLSGIDAATVALVRTVFVEKATAMIAADIETITAKALSTAEIADVEGITVAEVELLRAEYARPGTKTGDWFTDQSKPTIT